MADPIVKPTAAPTTPAPVPDTKTIALPSYSKRIDRDLKKIAAEKAAVEARQKEIDAYSPRVKAYTEALDLVKQGKFKEFLDKAGLTREQVAQAYGFTSVAAAVKAGAIPGKPTTTPAPAETKVDPAVAELKAEVAALKKAREEEVAAAKTQAFESSKKAYLDSIQDHALKDKETYAYTSQAVELDAEDVRDLMFQVADEWCKANPTEKGVPPAQMVADAVEAFYEKEAERYSKVQKKPKVVADPAAPAPKVEEKGVAAKLAEQPKSEQPWRRPSPQEILRELNANSPKR